MELLPYDESMFTDYVRFAKSGWGERSYQATRRYIEWLHGAQGVAHEPGDFMLARTRDDARRIVGCIHKMRIDWALEDGSVAPVPAVHNWLVDEGFRNGVGVMLLTKALRSDPHAFVSSAAADLAIIYRKLRCQEVRAAWYRRVIRPLTGGLRLGVERATKRTLPLPFMPIAKGPTETFRSLEIVTDPSELELDAMIAALARAAAGRCRPLWTRASFSWRFFHPRGPQHVVLRADPERFLIVALAPYRGLRVARVVELCLGAPLGARELLRDAEAFLKSSQIHVVLAYSAHARENAALMANGFHPLPKSQPSFFHHGPRQPTFGRWAFNGGAADFGFEALAG